MSFSAMTNASLQFGIEIELLLGGRKKAHSSWKSLANDLSKRLAAAGIPNHINDGGDKAVEHYREYSIVREVTIPNQLAKGLCTPMPLSSTELSALAKAALYFEPALDQLVPADRRASTAYWCQSNRASVGLRSMSLQDCLGMVDAAVDLSTTSLGNESFESGRTQALVGTMNLYPATSTYGRAHGKKHDFVRGKVYKWDFSRMLPRSSSSKGSNVALSQGTVEFRQPPGSRSAEDAKGWITLVLALVAGATKTTSWAPLGAPGVEGATIGELWALILTGASVLGWEGVGDAALIFSKRTM
ncbi:hypothetical protein J7T55_009480 [Diaporthe amygdali]|uniref:uncharacterized protein n=1 Tax=Phomopsis amygdali TaxID=1214568 RepID=UPI0022FEBBBE|nr:uncharacterized protein J7T55_009480 [Diaporthe amygdali]KAJ0104316.1 hypothetical protein J7T55_009480 [Diaporthe amygdali]